MQVHSRPRHRFIPFRKKDIIEMCLASGGLEATEQGKFRAFCHLLQSLFHFEYHQTLETLKDLYAPLNPDRDTRTIDLVDDDTEVSFTDTLDALLDKANYEKLTQADIAAAFQESSLFQLKLDINFDDFEEVSLYVRGESIRNEKVSSLWGLKKRDISFSNFDRVVIYIKYKDGVVAGTANGKPGATLLKLFQNVPRADVEMLFPNTKVGMRNLDKLMIGVPAVAGAVAIFTTQAGASLLLLASLIGFWLGLRSEAVEINEAVLLAILAGVGGVGSYIWKQFSNFRNRKLLFMQSLTQNLYFKNLDNNAGVFHRLIDDAEEEECKEAILAYYTLLTEPQISDTAALDQKVEVWFQDRWETEIDFEVDDAVGKLLQLQLMSPADDGLAVVDLPVACETLDQKWDQFFSFSDAAP